MSNVSASSVSRSTVGLASSGTSPTLRKRAQARVHLVGAGQVGRAFLRRADELALTIVAVSDSRATLYDRDGLDSAHIARAKATGAPLAALGRADELATQLAVALVESDVLADACASDPRAPQAAVERAETALARGARVCLAAKDALLARAHAWRDAIASGRIGWNAALGGTGRRLAAELDALSSNTAEIALVANATTSAVLERLEAGYDLDLALAHARALGLCEADATLDLDGTDAATKLAIVASALFERPIALSEIEREDLRALDVELVRSRCREGLTTRVVARATRTGALSVRCEAVRRSSILAAPPDRVVYAYRSRSATTRVHVGHGLGAVGTAASLVADVLGAEGGVA